MAKRRTKKQKLKAHSQPRLQKRDKETIAVAGSYLGRDLHKSLVIILFILALEIGWWFFSNR